MNKLLMEENDRLQKQVSHLVYENGYMRQQLHSVIPFTSILNYPVTLSFSWFSFRRIRTVILMFVFQQLCFYYYYFTILVPLKLNCIIQFWFLLCNWELFLSIKQASGTTTDNSCESVVMSGQPQQQQNPNPQHPNRDVNNPAGSVYLTLCLIFR